MTGPPLTGVFPRRCASDCLQRLVRTDVEGWRRRCRVPRRMLFGTRAIFVLSLLALTGDLRPKLDKVPHECVSSADVIRCQRAYHRCRSWLFPQIDAALHHGGAGTTGASLRGEKIPSAWQPFIYRVGVSWYSNAYPPLVWVSRGGGS